MADSPPPKKRRGRKPTKVDVEARLQRSRQSARECRARKKMRYKSLEDIVAAKEAENLRMRDEIKQCLVLAEQVEAGKKIPEKVIKQFKEDLEVDEESDPSDKEG